MRHHTWLIFVFLVETGFHHVGQPGLELLTSDPPASASQSAKITGVSHYAWPAIGFLPNLRTVHLHLSSSCLCGLWGYIFKEMRKDMPGFLGL